MSLRAISYGGGVQSTALVVLAAQGELDFPLAIFANVGDDSEHPATLQYVREVAAPWAAEHDVEVFEVRRRFADGAIYPTLVETLTDPGRRGIPIPLYINGKMPARRSCTASWKVEPIMRELQRRGATAENPATVAVGISVDEMERAGRGRDNEWERRVYPLLDLGMTRADCMKVTADAGLPVPPKSACFFCPYHRKQAWRDLRRDEPKLFATAAHLEWRINERQRLHGSPDRYYLTKGTRPLDEAITEAQTPLFADGPESCDEGYCWT